MKRSGPPSSDPEKHHEWQARSTRAYRQRQARERAAGASFGAVGPGMVRKAQKATQSRARRNDAPWRETCLARRGRYCRACGWIEVPRGGIPPRLEIDHVMPRSQGGASVVENGLVLCESHHRQKTESRILIRRDWLDPDQVAWLASVGWVEWDERGEPRGRGWRHFAPMVGAAEGDG